VLNNRYNISSIPELILLTNLKEHRHSLASSLSSIVTLRRNLKANIIAALEETLA